MERLNALDEGNHIAWSKSGLNPQAVHVPILQQHLS